MGQGLETPKVAVLVEDPILHLCHVCRGVAQVLLSLQAVHDIDDQYIAKPVARLMTQVQIVEALHKGGKL